MPAQPDRSLRLVYRQIAPPSIHNLPSTRATGAVIIISLLESQMMQAELMESAKEENVHRHWIESGAWSPRRRSTGVGTLTGELAVDVLRTELSAYERQRGGIPRTKEGHRMWVAFPEQPGRVLERSTEAAWKLE